MGKLLIVDTETTDLGPIGGVNPRTGQVGKGRIVSIAWQILVGWNIVESFYSLVNPGKMDADPEAMAVNKLDPELIALAPTFKELVPQIRNAFQNCDIKCGQNLPFDLGFIQAELMIAGENTRLLYGSDTLVDTQRLGLKYLPNLCMPGNKHGPSLTVMARHYDIQYEAHNALADVDTTRQVLFRLAQNATPGEDMLNQIQCMLK